MAGERIPLTTRQLTLVEKLVDSAGGSIDCDDFVAGFSADPTPTPRVFASGGKKKKKKGSKKGKGSGEKRSAKKGGKGTDQKATTANATSLRPPFDPRIITPPEPPAAPSFSAPSLSPLGPLSTEHPPVLSSDCRITMFDAAKHGDVSRSAAPSKRFPSLPGFTYSLFGVRFTSFFFILHDCPKVATLASASARDNRALNGVNRYKKSALHAAAMYDQVEALKSLLGAGACVDQRDANDFTPLMLACLHGSAEAVALLVDAGANVNAVSRGGGTPLIRAVDRRGPSAAVVEGLIRAGADVFAKTGAGHTAYDFCQRWKKESAEHADIGDMIYMEMKAVDPKKMAKLEADKEADGGKKSKGKKKKSGGKKKKGSKKGSKKGKADAKSVAKEKPAPPPVSLTAKGAWQGSEWVERIARDAAKWKVYGSLVLSAEQKTVLKNMPQAFKGAGGSVV